MKKSLLTLSVSVALLAGCGGSGDSNDLDNTNSIINDGNTKIISVIDGYLENADVYIDRNSNGIADEDEKLTEKTDSQGKIVIAVADAQFDLIAQINGNTTKDSDGTGTTGHSYQMIAKAGLDFITPFTTIAKIQNKSLSEVATDLNIDESIVSGDYVALKLNAEKGGEAKKAHAYARNLTSALAETVVANQESSVSRFLETIKVDIEQAITNDVDLDSIVSDVVELEDIIVGGSTFYSVVVNAKASAREDISTYNYYKNGSFTFKNDIGEQSGKFSVTGNQVIYDDKSFGDSLLYVSQENYIQVSPLGYLDIYSKSKDPLSISTSMFAGTNWYQLFDDGIDSTRPCFIKVQFTSTSEMKYIESGSCEVSDLNSEEGTEYPYHWTVVDNELSIYDNEAGVEGGEADFVVISKSTRLLVLENTRTNKFSVFIKDKALATSIFSAWSLELAR
jgi:hypothetical protein